MVTLVRLDTQTSGDLVASRVTTSSTRTFVSESEVTRIYSAFQTSGGTISGPLEVTGLTKLGSLHAIGSTFDVDSPNVNLKYGLNLNCGSSVSDVVINVSRPLASTYLKWNETTDRWTLYDVGSLSEANIIHSKDLSSTSAIGIIKISSIDGLAVASGVLSATTASTASFGIVKISTSNGLTIANGVLSVQLGSGAALGFGTLRVPTSNGLSVAAGTLSMAVASRTSFGTINVPDTQDAISHGLHVSAGSLRMSLAVPTGISQCAGSMFPRIDHGLTYIESTGELDCPVASPTVLGVVKIGGGINITDGTISTTGSATIAVTTGHGLNYTGSILSMNAGTTTGMGTVQISTANGLTLSSVTGGTLSISRATATQLGTVFVSSENGLTLDVNSKLSLGLASAMEFGTVRIYNGDGLSIVSGILSATTASTASFGVVKISTEDGLSIFSGVLSAQTGGTDNFGVFRIIDNNGLSVSSGVVSVGIAGKVPTSFGSAIATLGTLFVNVYDGLRYNEALGEIGIYRATDTQLGTVKVSTGLGLYFESDTLNVRIANKEAYGDLGTVSPITGHGLSYNNGTGELNCSIATSSIIGVVMPQVGNGLALDESGKLSIGKADNSNIGTVQIASNSGLTINSGILGSAIATVSVLGSVKIGSGINVASDGTISTTGAASITTASTTGFGVVQIGSGINVVNGVISTTGAASITTASTENFGVVKIIALSGLSITNGLLGSAVATPSILGSVKIGSGISVAPDGTISTTGSATIAVTTGHGLNYTGSILSMNAGTTTGMGTVQISTANGLTLSSVTGGTLNISRATATQLGTVMVSAGNGLVFDSDAISMNMAHHKGHYPEAGTVIPITGHGLIYNYNSGELDCPIASTYTMGAVVITTSNGLTITSNGKLSVALCSTSVFGTVKISSSAGLSIAAGVLSATTASTASFGIVRVAGSSGLTINGGVIGSSIASATVLGSIKVGTGLSVSVDGTITVTGTTLTVTEGTGLAYAGNILTMNKASQFGMGTVRISSTPGLIIDSGILSVDTGSTLQLGVVQIIQQHGLTISDGIISMALAQAEGDVVIGSAGAVQPIVNYGLLYNNTLGVLGLQYATTEQFGTVQISSGNGLVISSGILSAQTGGTSTFGVLKVVNANGLSVSNGIVNQAIAIAGGGVNIGIAGSVYPVTGHGLTYSVGALDCPIATSSILGVVMPQLDHGLTVDSGGKLSINPATTTGFGSVKISSGDGLTIAAGILSVTTASTSTLGIMKLRIDSNGLSINEGELSLNPSSSYSGIFGSTVLTAGTVYINTHDGLRYDSGGELGIYIATSGQVGTCKHIVTEDFVCVGNALGESFSILENCDAGAWGSPNRYHPVWYAGLYMHEGTGSTHRDVYWINKKQFHINLSTTPGKIVTVNYILL